MFSIIDQNYQDSLVAAGTTSGKALPLTTMRIPPGFLLNWARSPHLRFLQFHILTGVIQFNSYLHRWFLTLTW